MRNPFRPVHRTFSDVADVMLFQPGKVGTIEGYSGQWTVAGVLCFVGMVAACYIDMPEMGVSGASLLGAAVLGVLIYWSRLDNEALQRSYVCAGTTGAFGVVYMVATTLPAKAVLTLWLAAAWLVYLRARMASPRR